ncbi:hypothetical protein BU15DRAFT_68570 [Melanogaster broomeanus]|nr:hypothetical protein BU15DRAFT_68570 [Melanogaster broomeanus]
MKSDTIILVLEAHEGCRARLVEEDIRRRESVGEKLIFVLNKIGNTALSPILPFCSASSNQRSNLFSATAPAVVRLLKAYKPSAAQSITIDVVGFPNVFKSSLINSLKRSKSCAVAARRTKDLQTVDLERGIKIIDSPGVVVDEDEDESSVSKGQKGSILPRNVVKVEDVEHPIAVGIFLLPILARKTDYIAKTKGGTPYVVSAAQQVLMDWNHQGPLLLRPILDPPVLHTFNGAQYRRRCRTWSRDHRPTSNPNRVVETVRASRMIRGYDGERYHGQEPEMVVAADMPARMPQKRSHLPSPVGAPHPAQARTQNQASDAAFMHTRKRLRHAKDLSAYEEAAARSYPFNRKMLKVDAKCTRRAATKLPKSLGQTSGMEVDELLNTFKLGIVLESSWTTWHPTSWIRAGRSCNHRSSPSIGRESPPELKKVTQKPWMLNISHAGFQLVNDRPGTCSPPEKSTSLQQPGACPSSYAPAQDATIGQHRAEMICHRSLSDTPVQKPTKIITRARESQSFQLESADPNVLQTLCSYATGGHAELATRSHLLHQTALK